MSSAKAEQARREMVEAALAADHERAVRDAFAGAVLGAMIAHGGVLGQPSDIERARRAYKYADAMMQARKEPT
jgi:uncharacterized protein YcfJ